MPNVLIHTSKFVVKKSYFKFFWKIQNPRGIIMSFAPVVRENTANQRKIPEAVFQVNNNYLEVKKIKGKY